MSSVISCGRQLLVPSPNICAVSLRCGLSDVNGWSLGGMCVRPTGEEAADGRVGGVRLLFEEEVAGAVDRDDFGAGEALA